MEKIEGFIGFTEKSIKKCIEDSENSVAAIMDLISQVSNNATRVSAVSDEALQILNHLKTALKNSEKNKVSDLNNAISEFKIQNRSVQSSVDSIVQSLQFQDRVTQNLNNILSMLNLWWKIRESEISITEFGKMLLDKTTMEEEKKIIKSEITGLPEAQEGSQKTLLF